MPEPDPRAELDQARAQRGGRGIGEATSTTLAYAGAAVVVVDKSKERADRVTASIRADGGRAVALHVDLRDQVAPARVIAGAIDAFGAMDVLVNVAGGMRAANAWRPLRENDAEDSRDVLLMGQAVLEKMSRPLDPESAAIAAHITDLLHQG